jgi:hypothetical protein
MNSDYTKILTRSYFDFLSNQPKNEVGRQNVANLLGYKFETRLEASIDRVWDLPPFMVNPDGEYLALLLEARDLYVDGYFYSCVATCGIVGERIIKDLLRASIKIEKDGTVDTPHSEAFDELEHAEAFRLAKFFLKAGMLSKETFKAAQNLLELRNHYAHARGREPQPDALKAIKLLHQVVEGTVSVFKDHELKDGLLVRKKAD